MATETPEQLIASLEAELEKCTDPEEIAQLQFGIRWMRSMLDNPTLRVAAEYATELNRSMAALDWENVERLLLNPVQEGVTLNLNDAALPIFEILNRIPLNTLMLICQFSNSESYQNVATLIRTNSYLQTLVLVESDLGDVGAMAIASALSEATLKTLSLNECNIGDAGGVAIAEALRVNTTLTFLNLVGNRMGPLAAKAFGELLQANTPLRELVLSGNPLGDVGLVNVVDGLRQNTTLVMLGLMGIHAQNFAPVGVLLRENATLMSLFLNNNTFLEVDSIVAALNENTTLLVLDLHSSKGVSEDVLQQIDTLCTRNKASRTEPLPETKIGFENAV